MINWASAHIMANNALYFIVLNKVASAIEYKAKVASEIIFLQNFLIRHVEHHLELHEQRAQKLLVATEEDLSPVCALVQHLAVLAF